MIDNQPCHEELLPCPWCDVAPNSGCNYGIGGAYVNCVNRDCKVNPEVFIAGEPGANSSLNLHQALIEARRYWNTRTPPISYEERMKKEIIAWYDNGSFNHNVRDHLLAAMGINGGK